MSMAHITTTHHERLAYVYVRQSTLWQVNEHQESTERQCRLQERALELGWPPTAIEVIVRIRGAQAVAPPHVLVFGASSLRSAWARSGWC